MKQYFSMRVSPELLAMIEARRAGRSVQETIRADLSTFYRLDKLRQWLGQVDSKAPGPLLAEADGALNDTEGS